MASSYLFQSGCFDLKIFTFVFVSNYEEVYIITQIAHETRFLSFIFYYKMIKTTYAVVLN